MDIQQEINTLIRRAMMEEINSLTIRETIREQIEAARITGEDIRTITQQTIDSYFRSAMGSYVEDKISSIFDRKVTETVEREIKKVIGSARGWSGSDDVRTALNAEAERAIRSGFDVSVSIKSQNG